MVDLDVLRKLGTPTSSDRERANEAAVEIERLQAILEAARLYEAWAKKGDYPHDEQGCEAHAAIREALRNYEQTRDGEG